jgi:hypothetical protein
MRVELRRFCIEAVLVAYLLLSAKEVRLGSSEQLGPSVCLPHACAFPPKLRPPLANTRTAMNYCCHV